MLALSTRVAIATSWTMSPTYSLDIGLVTGKMLKFPEFGIRSRAMAALMLDGSFQLLSVFNLI